MTSVFTRLPAGLNLKGGNITFRPSDRLISIAHSYQPGWSCLWGGDGGTFDLAYFQRLIDLTASLGGNAVRVMGDLSALKRGTLVQSDFLTNVRLVLSYAQSQGVYVYWTLSPTQQLDNMTAADVVTYGLPILQAVQQYPCVFAVDMLQEISSWVAGGTVQPSITLSQLTTACQTVYQGLKPSAQVPLTFSGAQASFDDAAIFSDQTYRTPLMPYMDFIDCHIYGGGSYVVRPIDLDPLITAFPGKDILIGEIGSSQDGSRGQDMAAAVDFAARSELSGMFVWALDDQDTTADDEWGIAADDGTLRPKASVFTLLPSVDKYYRRLLYGEQFDQAAVIPGGWAMSVTGAFAYGSGNIVSGAMSAPQFFYYRQKDGNNGNTMAVQFVNLADGACVGAVFTRCMAGPTPGGAAGTTMYYLNMTAGQSVVLSRLLNGNGTALATVNTAAPAGTYRLVIASIGAHVMGAVQDMGTLQWMRPDGTFQGGPTFCAALKDPAPIDGTGGGLSGAWAYDGTGGKVHIGNCFAYEVNPPTPGASSGAGVGSRAASKGGH